MDTHETTKIADSFSERAGYSVTGLKANVISPADREHEVVFMTTDENEDGESLFHRVFLGQTGRFIGLRLADGTSPTCIDTKLLNFNHEDPLVETATRYLRAHGVDVAHLQPTLLETPGFTKVWYEEDSDRDLLGGWHTVFLLENGELIHIQEDQ